MSIAFVFSVAFAAAPPGLGLAADDGEGHAREATATETEKVSDSEDAEGGDGEALGSDRLSAHEYFTMAPFIIPIIENGRHRKQFVIVVAIGLKDEGDRNELRRLSPKMRNEIYQMLFRLVSFRTVEPRIPRNEVLENRLARIARQVAGEEMVKSLVVHSAAVTDVH